MLKQISDVVLEAGNIVSSGFHSAKTIKHKGAVDLVTEYDVRTENFLKEKLQKLFPTFTIVGEETHAERNYPAENVIFIDPIDGTTNFVKGFQHSAISVGLAKDKELIAGVVLDPDLDNLFYAEKGKGAYLNGKPIHVSDCALKESLVLFGTCPYEHELAEKTFKLTEQIFYNCLEVRRCGSAALDICYVAAGKADLYYELILRPWDLAGATVILREAGGICKTVEGDV